MMNMLEAARPETNPSDLQQYVVHSRVEILATLRNIIRLRPFVTIYFNQGNDFIVTQLLHVDENDNTLFLDYGADQETNKALLNATRMAVVTFIESIKIQFQTGQAKTTQFDGRAALELRIPESLLRLQRRDFYRVPSPISRPVICTAHIPAANDQSIELKIVDISVGGIGVMLTQPGIKLQVGDVLPGGMIVLPEFGEIHSTLEVRYIEADSEHPEHETSPGQHIGCRFVDLPGPMLTLLQRFINKVDRDRRALSKANNE